MIKHNNIRWLRVTQEMIPAERVSYLEEVKTILVPIESTSEKEDGYTYQCLKIRGENALYRILLPTEFVTLSATTIIEKLMSFPWLKRYGGAFPLEKASAMLGDFDDDPYVIYTPFPGGVSYEGEEYEEDDADVFHREGGDGPNGDVFEELDIENEDDPAEDVSAVEMSLNDLEDECEKAGISSEDAFFTHASDITDKYDDVISLINKIMVEMSPNDIAKLTARVREGPRKVVAVSGESATPEGIPSPTTIPEVQKPKESKTLIRLKKGLQAFEIEEYVKQIHAALVDKPHKVHVDCPDWADAPHYAMVPACKKLLQKYIEHGLLGCLVYHDYQRLGHELYCAAYLKGKMLDGGQISFGNMKVDEYKKVLIPSSLKFASLIDPDSAKDFISKHSGKQEEKK